MKLTEAESEVDRNKEMYITLSQERETSSDRVRVEFESRLENFQQKVTERDKV